MIEIKLRIPKDIQEGAIYTLQIEEENTLPNIRDFGAIGDGIANDVEALMAGFNYGSIELNKGETYYIDEYKYPKNAGKEIIIKDLKDAVINGNNSIISVKGDFHRPNIAAEGKRSISDTWQKNALRLNNCKNITINGLELYGNVDKMTKDKGVIEREGYGLIISSCENIELNNINTHHFSTDGLTVGGLSKNITIDNFHSDNNARQGFTIGGVIGLLVKNSTFNETGNTGEYGAHSPQAGLDIEPNHSTGVVRDVEFNNCEFVNNFAALALSHISTTSDVRFIDCKFKMNERASPYAVIINSKEILFENCEFDLAYSDIYTFWYGNDATSIFRNCHIKSTRGAIMAISEHPDASCVFENCTIEYTGEGITKRWFPFIRSTKTKLIDCTIILPTWSLRSKSFQGLIQNAVVKNLKMIDENGNDMKRWFSFDGATFIDEESIEPPNTEPEGPTVCTLPTGMKVTRTAKGQVTMSFDEVDKGVTHLKISLYDPALKGTETIPIADFPKSNPVAPTKKYKIKVVAICVDGESEESDFIAEK